MLDHLRITQTRYSISGTTTIDLSAGNAIYFTHNTDTTVAFANTESVQKVQFIRKRTKLRLLDLLHGFHLLYGMVALNPH